MIPVPSGEKNPARPGWEALRITEEEIPDYWTNGQNVGLLCGKPSGWRVDVDLDADQAVKIAGRFLPPTFTSGRLSRPHSLHLIGIHFHRAHRAAESILSLHRAQDLALHMDVVVGAKPDGASVGVHDSTPVHFLGIGPHLEGHLITAALRVIKKLADNVHFVAYVLVWVGSQDSVIRFGECIDLTCVLISRSSLAFFGVAAIRASASLA